MENHGAAENSVNIAMFILGLRPPSADQQFATPLFVVRIPADAGSDKPETSPASKASIDALPKITVTEDCVHDCAICLDEMNVGGESREMPCKHRFHSSCIVKWLGIHGSCPVCRFMMPVEDDDGGDGSVNGRRQRRRLVSVNLIVFDPVGLLPGSDSDSGSGEIGR